MSLNKEALSKLKSSPNDYAAVVLDRIMPHMSGMEVLREMKNFPELEQIPVIMLTGVDESEEIAEAIKCGAIDYLTKPVDKKLLIQLLEQVLK